MMVEIASAKANPDLPDWKGGSVSKLRPVALDSTNAAQAAFLRANSEIYEWLAKKAQGIDRRKNAEVVLDRVSRAAQFAEMFHPGRFADGAIENLALKIGAEFGEFMIERRGSVLPASRKDGRRRVLHVASCVRAVGGHTRMMYHWVRNDQGSCHSLVVVNQRDVPLPQWLFEAIRGSGGDLAVLPQGSCLCQKAKWLRDAAARAADLVVLHHGAADVVPTVAFGVHESPPVALLNHADHTFWLGSSVSDMVINLRTVGSEHTATRRFVSSNTVVPIPLADPVRQMSRRDARRVLGIPDDQVVLLSVGRAEKYRPCGPYDFVATAGKILDRQPGAHMYVVGESLAGIAPYVRYALHERLHFVGSIEDPSLYRAAADIYLESFPFGSNTALLEAAFSGLSVIPAYAPLFPLLVANDDAVQDLLPNPHDEEEYIERVNVLIQRPDQRVALGKTLRERLLIDHVGEGWLHRIAAVYQKTDRLTHRPAPIPASSCSITDADVGLSLWNTVADGKTNFASASGDGPGAVLRHKAFLAKYVGDYATARRVAWRAVRHDPYQRASWRLLAATVLGRVGTVIRPLLRRA